MNIFREPYEDMAHGWLVLPFSAWIIWTQRKQYHECASAPSWVGMVWSIFFILLDWLGGRGSQFRIEQLAFAGLVWSIPYAFWGKAVGRLMVFPAAFLLFAVPISSYLDFFTIRLRLISSSVATGTLNGIGIPVERSGTALFSRAPGAEFNVDVADPCSGIRSLFALMAISAGYAYLVQKTLFRKWILFFCSLPIAVFGNTIRIMSICLMATWFGQEVATGYYHDYSGYITFLVGLSLLFGASNLLTKYGERLEKHLPAKLDFLRRLETQETQKKASVWNGIPSVRAWSVITLILLSFFTLFFFTRHLAQPVLQPDTFVSKNLPDQIGEFIGITPYFCHNEHCLQSYQETDLIRRNAVKKGKDGKKQYTCPSCGKPLHTVSLGEYSILPKDTVILKKNYISPDGMSYSVSIVIAGEHRGSIHRAEVCLPAQGFRMSGAETMTIQLDGKDVTCRKILAERTESKTPFNLIYWFETPERHCSSHFIRIFTDVWDRSIHNRINRWIMISIRVSVDLSTPESVERFQNFISEFYRKVIHKKNKDMSNHQIQKQLNP